MERIEGKLALGEKVKFFTKMDPSRAFPVTVTAFEPNKRLVLSGGIPLGLFKSERTHTLTTNPDGSTTFKTEEIFERSAPPPLRQKHPRPDRQLRGVRRRVKGPGREEKVG